MAKNLNLINILFFIIIFPVLAFLIEDYLVYGYAAGKSIPRTSFTVPAPSAAPLIGSYASIVETPIFPSESLEFKPVSVPDDMLMGEGLSYAPGSLRLVGTIVGKESLVIIEKKGEGVEKTFRVGDTVFDAGVLRQVTRESALISSGSGEFTLAMPKENLPEDGGASRDNAADYQAARNIVWRPDESVRKTGENAWAVDQKAIAHALDNIGQVLSDARLTPVQSRDGVEGFLVNEVAPRGIFDIIGLKNGDILKRVNGFEVTTPEKAVQVLMGLRGETKIEIDIVRGGKKIKLQYDIR